MDLSVKVILSFDEEILQWRKIECEGGNVRLKGENFFFQEIICTLQGRKFILQIENFKEEFSTLNEEKFTLKWDKEKLCYPESFLSSK